MPPLTLILSVIGPVLGLIGVIYAQRVSARQRDAQTVLAEVQAIKVVVDSLREDNDDLRSERTALREELAALRAEIHTLTRQMRTLVTRIKGFLPPESVASLLDGIAGVDDH